MGQAVLQMSLETMAEVVDAVEATESAGAQVDWINREIVRILKVLEHQQLTVRIS